VSPIIGTVSPIAATVSPIIATVSPIIATVSPIIATVSPITETVSAIIETVSPIIARESAVLAREGALMATESAVERPQPCHLRRGRSRAAYVLGLAVAVRRGGGGSVAVMVGLERALGRNAQVIRLLFGELGELHA
jgi:hypothetical protein